MENLTGDGGPAINAQLQTPTAVCVDEVGNIYIADQENGRIRKISTSSASSDTFITVADGNWDNPATWSGGVVPSSTSQVVIHNNITVTSNAACYSLKVEQPTGKLTIQANIKLTVFH